MNICVHGAMQWTGVYSQCPWPRQMHSDWNNLITEDDELNVTWLLSGFVGIY